MINPHAMTKPRTTLDTWISFLQGVLLIAMMLGVAYCDSKKHNQPRPAMGRHSQR
jgi:hypothetical protein